MNKKEFLDKYQNKAAHCPTEDLANEFLGLAYGFGIEWFSGSKKNIRWDWYTVETCYIIGIDNKLTFGDVDYFKSKNYEIIEFKKEKKMKYKDILKNKELLEKEVPAEILKMLGLKNKGFEIGEKYYCINSYEGIICDYWDNITIDTYRLKHCYASKTEEECIFKKEKQEVLAELRQFAEENNTEEIEWENCRQTKWYLVCNYIYKRIEIFTDTSYKHLNDIYFTSEELAKQAVAKIGEDRIKKYLFGVGV